MNGRWRSFNDDGLTLIYRVLHDHPTGPRFEDYPTTETFNGTPAQPILTTSDERRFRSVIRQGVTKGWGVEAGMTGKQFALPEPNFAGHYVIVRWGCGSECLMAAIVDLKTGRVFSPPFHHGRMCCNFLGKRGWARNVRDTSISGSEFE